MIVELHRRQGFYFKIIISVLGSRIFLFNYIGTLKGYSGSLLFIYNLFFVFRINRYLSKEKLKLLGKYIHDNLRKVNNY